MNTTLERRLNVAHVAVVRAGTSRPRTRLDDQLTGVVQAPTPEETGSRKPGPRKPVRRKMTAEQAKKMAADLDGYDGQIKSGRLVT